MIRKLSPEQIEALRVISDLLCFVRNEKYKHLFDQGFVDWVWHGGTRMLTITQAGCKALKEADG